MTRKIFFLAVKDIVAIHDFQISEFGGKSGIINNNLLESAAGTPQITFGSKYLHKNIYQMAAAYMFHIVKNHPFYDGNKRTGTFVTIAFLKKNKIVLLMNNDEVYDLALRVANSEVSKTMLEKILKQNSLKF